MELSEDTFNEHMSTFLIALNIDAANNSTIVLVENIRRSCTEFINLQKLARVQVVVDRDFPLTEALLSAEMTPPSDFHGSVIPINTNHDSVPQDEFINANHIITTDGTVLSSYTLQPTTDTIFELQKCYPFHSLINIPRVSDLVRESPRFRNAALLVGNL